MPYSGARRAMWATRALATSVFVGVQPVLTQVPPTSLPSTTATESPSGRPPSSVPVAWPEPTMMWS